MRWHLALHSTEAFAKLRVCEVRAAHGRNKLHGLRWLGETTEHLVCWLPSRRKGAQRLRPINVALVRGGMLLARSVKHNVGSGGGYSGSRRHAYILIHIPAVKETLATKTKGKRLMIQRRSCSPFPARADGGGGPAYLGAVPPTLRWMKSSRPSYLLGAGGGLFEACLHQSDYDGLASCVRPGAARSLPDWLSRRCSRWLVAAS